LNNRVKNMSWDFDYDYDDELNFCPITGSTCYRCDKIDCDDCFVSDYEYKQMSLKGYK